MTVYLWQTGHEMLPVGITLLLVAICGGPRRCGVTGSGVFATGTALMATGEAVQHDWLSAAIYGVIAAIGAYCCVAGARKLPRRPAPDWQPPGLSRPCPPECRIQVEHRHYPAESVR